MLGKRCRTIQRTASISQNMGPHLQRHQNSQDMAMPAAKAINHVEAISMISPVSLASKPQVPAIIPQIIGFHPVIRSSNRGVCGSDFKSYRHDTSEEVALPNSSSPRPLHNAFLSRPHPHDMYDDDPRRYQNKNFAALIQSTDNVVSPTESKRDAIAPAQNKDASTDKPMVPRSALQALLEAAKLVRSNDISASSGNSFKGRETSKLSLVGGQKSPTPASGTITLNRIPGSMIWHGQASNSEADLAKVIEASNSETDPGKEIEASNSEADPAKEIVADKHYCYSKASIQCTSQPTGSVSQESELLQMMTEAPQETQMSSSMSEVLIEDHLDAEGTSSNSISAVSHRPSSVESVKDQHALIYLATSPISYIDATPRLAAPMSFFDSCQLCKHPLGPGRDIFMYSIASSCPFLEFSGFLHWLKAIIA